MYNGSAPVASPDVLNLARPTGEKMVIRRLHTSARAPPAICNTLGQLRRVGHFQNPSAAVPVRATLEHQGESEILLDKPLPRGGGKGLRLDRLEAGTTVARLELVRHRTA